MGVASYSILMTGNPSYPTDNTITVRSGPGTKYSSPFETNTGMVLYTLLDIKPDEDFHGEDGQVYQWFNLTFYDGRSGWVRDDSIDVLGDLTAFGYPSFSGQVKARDLQRAGAPAVRTVTPQPAETRLLKPEPATQTDAGAKMEPARKIDGSGGAVNTWNKFGGLLGQLGSSHGIDPVTIAAIIAIESRGNGFVNGKLKIRFENHLFRRAMDRAGRLADYDKHFRGIKWDDRHEYLKDGQWMNVHGDGQNSEHEALTLAATLDAEAAHDSISMGAPQILGSNSKMVGYKTAVEMFQAFSQGEGEQVRGMFEFLKNSSLIDAMRANNFAAVAEKYNGPGNVGTYSKKMQIAYDEVKSKTG